MNCPWHWSFRSGTGAPDKIKRGPMAPGGIGLIGAPGGALHRLPSFGDDSGFVPVRPVEPPLEAKKA